VINSIGEYFQTNLSNSNYNDEFLINRHRYYFPQNTIDPNDTTQILINSQITTDELEMVLRTNKRKSPGPDVSLIFLFKIYPSTVSNTYLTSGFVIPILKPNKNK
jgi:hypothetical protein